MGIFSSAEKKLESAVGGVFARAFKGDVQPVEITHKLCKELDNKAQILARDKRLVPNNFLVSLSKHDYARLFPYSKTMTAEITADLREYAAEHEYIFNGPISIQLEERPDLPVGRFAVSSDTVAEVNQAPAALGTLRTANLVVEVNGVRHPLTPPGFTVGRGADADLRINDPGISRTHAQFVVTGTGASLRVKILDLHSTNGILVDGRKVTEAELGDGSRIDIGKTQMLVYAPSGG
ncbi:MAG: DUF3662 domain-containing protein [Propionibacteriaceae bacterium]|jgi:hypothetical protein|nr:DUF3662 domain-containing protein [Propionibacteriaceae bacterium]